MELLASRFASQRISAFDHFRFLLFPPRIIHSMLYSTVHLSPFSPSQREMSCKWYNIAYKLHLTHPNPQRLLCSNSEIRERFSWEKSAKNKEEPKVLQEKTLPKLENQHQLKCLEVRQSHAANAVLSEHPRGAKQDKLSYTSMYDAKNAIRESCISANRRGTCW